MIGVHVPFGFAVTAYSYFHFLRQNSIEGEIRDALTGLDIDNIAALQSSGARCRDLILKSPFPEDLAKAITDAYAKLEQKYGQHVDVAVRSSATAEDLPDASFAGQQETFLNIRGSALLDACKRCLASLFTNRAISYRVTKKFDHMAIGLSIGVQLMVQSQSSGVMFSIDTESGFKDTVLINGCWGLGENVVQGNVNPDEWLVFKPTLAMGFSPILKSRLGTKEFTMVYAEQSNAAGKSVVNKRTPINKREQFCLSEEEVLQLARWGAIIESYYSERKGSVCPMDMEWAKDSKSGQLFIVQARPETVHSLNKDHQKLRTYVLKSDRTKLKCLARGSSVGAKIGAGKASVILNVGAGMDAFEAGSVLVTEQTDPDWEPILAKASAVITNRGGRTCHAAIISRELGIPCLVGCGDATLTISHGASVTLDCTAGETGAVYEGIQPFGVEEVDLATVPKTKTKVALLLGNPDLAFEHSFLPNDGVGLMRMEFIVSSYIKVHPMALVHPEKLSPGDQKAICNLIGGGLTTLTREVGSNYFIERLASGVATMAAAFYPKPVILRFSDFKTDEYANLLGGKLFEPVEDNPMLGWRGASRYYDPLYREGFALECAAVKRVREKMGLTNLWVMVPFVRTVNELKDVYAEMEKNGLKRGEPKEAPLKHIMMCEIPANVILAPQFLDLTDGFSIGSNDLTQLTLGIDRNSAQISRLYDERNEAVTTLILQVIKEANARGKYIGICGQAPSDYPEFCEMLVKAGIGSISVQPDRIVSTHLLVDETERTMRK